MSRLFDPSLTWKDGDIPFSTGFDDIYYKADGLDETRVVFLEGNNLPQAWIGQKQFTICETGFGTGLNFLSAWKLFDETTSGHERLDFISVEQYPLHVDDLRRSLERLKPVFGAERIERFVSVYPMRIPGFHRRWISDRLTLTVIFDDALRAFKQLECDVDAWFLDGFNPAKNESLWQEELFAEMARLSHEQTTLASYTAVTSIRQALQKVGFSIERVKGYGYKKHRIIGKYAGDRKKKTVPTPETVHIIGAGLAGAGIAHALKRRGIKAEVFEKEATLGCGASGNQLGLINPKIEAQDNPRNDAGLGAFSFAQHILQDLSNIDYQKTGALHLAMDADKHERFIKLQENACWFEHMQWVDASKTKDICGISLQMDGLFYPDSGSVNTRKLVQSLLNGTTIHFNTSPALSSENLTVLACGWGLKEIDALASLPLQPVRGQVTYVQAPTDLKCPVLFGNYAAQTQNGLWALGASFEQNQDDPIIQDSVHQKNKNAAQKILGVEIGAVIEEWVQIRTASRDRFPIVGKVQNNLYVSGALGSHGIQFSLLFGEIIACELTGAPTPIGKDVLEKISINRFRG